MDTTSRELVSRAKAYFCALHDLDCNQKYDNTLPYSFHLKAVDSQVKRYGHLIAPPDLPIARAGAYGHDSIEDARISYNEVKDEFGFEVAEIVFLCSEYRGRTRDERKPKEFFIALLENKLATFVKLCDIMANVKFGLLTNSSQFQRYKEEHEKKIRPYLWSVQFQEIFNDFDIIFKLNNK